MSRSGKGWTHTLWLKEHLWIKKDSLLKEDCWEKVWKTSLSFSGRCPPVSNPFSNHSRACFILLSIQFQAHSINFTSISLTHAVLFQQNVGLFFFSFSRSWGVTDQMFRAQFFMGHFNQDIVFWLGGNKKYSTRVDICENDAYKCLCRTAGLIVTLGSYLTGWHLLSIKIMAVWHLELIKQTILKPKMRWWFSFPICIKIALCSRITMFTHKTHLKLKIEKKKRRTFNTLTRWNFQIAYYV